jgi:hypothetical protein
LEGFTGPEPGMESPGFRVRRKDEITGDSGTRESPRILQTLTGGCEAGGRFLKLTKERLLPSTHDRDFLLSMPCGRRWRGDGFRLRCARDDRPRGDRYVCAALSFGCPLLGFDRISFSVGNFSGTAFGGAAVGCTAVSFGYALFSLGYAALMLGFGEGHCAPSENVLAASQELRLSTSK